MIILVRSSPYYIMLYIGPVKNQKVVLAVINTRVMNQRFLFRYHNFTSLVAK